MENHPFSMAMLVITSWLVWFVFLVQESLDPRAPRTFFVDAEMLIHNTDCTHIIINRIVHI